MFGCIAGREQFLLQVRDHFRPRPDRGEGNILFPGIAPRHICCLAIFYMYVPKAAFVFVYRVVTRRAPLLSSLKVRSPCCLTRTEQILGGTPIHALRLCSLPETKERNGR